MTALPLRGSLAAVAGAALALAALGPAADAPAQPAAEGPRIEPAHRESEAERLLAAQPTDRVARLLEDRVVLFRSADDGYDRFLQALVLFDRPLERVLRLMVQTARQIEYRSELGSIETVERFPGGCVDEHRIRFMFTRLRYRLRNEFDFERHRMRWELDPEFDNGLSRLDGFWHFYAFEEDRTLGHFGSAMDLGGLPRFLEDYASRRQIPETLERARRWVDSDGRWRP